MGIAAADARQSDASLSEGKRKIRDMRRSYERWTLERLMERPRCSVEPSMSCIPLRGDPICMSCFEAEAGNPACPPVG